MLRNNGGWKRINEIEWRHPSGLRIWIEELKSGKNGFIIVTQTGYYPGTALDEKVFAKFEDAEMLALEFIKENPEGR